MAVSSNGNTPATFDAGTSRSQWLKGVLELCLLSTIGDGEVYGYEVRQQLEAAGFGEIKGGTVYPRLAALEKAGLVETEWRQGPSGPGRKYYRATPAGVAHRDEAITEYRLFTQMIHTMLSENEKETNK